MSIAAERFARLADAALNGPGELDAERRRAAFDGVGPADALGWVRRVHEGAATIEDEHLGELRAAGLTDDQAFELTICAAAGAADRRLRAALAALDAAFGDAP